MATAGVERRLIPHSLLLLSQCWLCSASSSNASSLSLMRTYSRRASCHEPQTHIAPVIDSLAEIESSFGKFVDPAKTLALLLDYDGTLAAIAPNSKDTYMAESLREVLRRLAADPRIFMAVISGRALNDVRERVNITGITYSGNHGMEIEMYDGKRLDYELPEDTRLKYDHLLKEMQTNLEKYGSWVEDKKISLTYHYRHAPLEKQEDQLKAAIRLIESSGYRVLKAHGAVEGKPPVDWHKGKAANCILEYRFGNDWPEEVGSVIFAGDDYTDEDAMKELQGLIKSIRISADPNIQTYGDFRFPCMQLMEDLLNWICKVYKIQ